LFYYSGIEGKKYSHSDLDPVVPHDRQVIRNTGDIMDALEFSVPYNSDPATLKEIFRLNKCSANRVREIYLSGPQRYSGSGRVAPAITTDEFVRVVDEIHNEGIRVNLTLNSTCEGIEWYSQKSIDTTMQYIGEMHEIRGVEAVTIANPRYIMEVRKRFPRIEICASVLGDIDCVQRAVLFQKAGADVLTIDVNINRDLQLLKDIKQATSTQLKLMVNEGCLYKCPFRKFHFNITSHVAKEVSRADIDYSYADFFDMCNQVIAEDHSQILKSGWIRPEDTRKYGEITSFFKVVGRTQRGSRVIRAAKAYLDERWSGDLLDLMCANLGSFSVNHGAYLDNEKLGELEFFEKTTTCERKCQQCSYCKDAIENLLVLNVVTMEKAEDVLPSND
jgi:collagenase-like PrtC family protease